MKQKLGFIQGVVYCKHYNANNNNNFFSLAEVFSCFLALWFTLRRGAS